MKALEVSELAMNKDELKEYEQKLYASFTQAGLEDVFGIWEIKSPGRVTHGMPYKHLSIYICTLDGEIASGLAVNRTYKNFQLEKFGFKVDKKHTSCEVLSLFSLHKSSRSNGQQLFFFALESLYAKGFCKIYTTASGIRARVYERMAGFNILDSKNINGVSKYLLGLDIEQKLGSIKSAGSA